MNDLHDRVRTWVWLCERNVGTWVSVWRYPSVYLISPPCSHQFLWWTNWIPPRLCLLSSWSHQYQEPSIADCPHQHHCLLLAVTGLAQWGIYASRKRTGGKVEQYSRGGGKLAVFSFFCAAFHPKSQWLNPAPSPAGILLFHFENLVSLLLVRLNQDSLCCP